MDCGGDLHQLCQRVLQPAPQAERPAGGDVQVGVLLGGQGRGGVHRRAGLVDHGAAQGAMEPLDEALHHFLGLAAGGAVADGHHVDVVAVRQLGQHALGLGHLAPRRRGVDGAVVQQLAVLVQHRQLAAGAVAGVQGDDARAPHRPLAQERLGVAGEDADGLGLGPLGELGAHLALQRGGDEAPVAVGDGGAERLRPGAASLKEPPFQPASGLVAVQAHPHAQRPLLLAAVGGQHPVTRDAPQAFRRAGRLGRVRLPHGLRGQLPVASREGAQGAQGLGVLGDDLGHDVLGAGQGIGGGGVGRALLGEGRSRHQGVAVAAALGHHALGQGLQAGFPRLRRPGGALLPKGLVEVLHPLEHRGLGDLGAQGVIELALLLDGSQHLFLAGLEAAQVGQAGVEVAQRGVVEAAGGLLAVARDEGNGAPLVQQRHHGGHLARVQAQVVGYEGRDVLHGLLLVEDGCAAGFGSAARCSGRRWACPSWRGRPGAASDRPAVRQRAIVPENQGPGQARSWPSRAGSGRVGSGPSALSLLLERPLPLELALLVEPGRQKRARPIERKRHYRGHRHSHGRAGAG